MPRDTRGKGSEGEERPIDNGRKNTDRMEVAGTILDMYAGDMEQRARLSILAFPFPGHSVSRF